MIRYQINRTYALAAAATTVALLETIDMGCMSGGSVQTTGAQTITIYGCNKDNPVGETFVAVYETGTSTQLSITAAGAGVFPLPPDCYSCRYIVLVDASGGDVYLHTKA